MQPVQKVSLESCEVYNQRYSEGKKWCCHKTALPLCLVILIKTTTIVGMFIQMKWQKYAIKQFRSRKIRDTNQEYKNQISPVRLVLNSWCCFWIYSKSSPYIINTTIIKVLNMCYNKIVIFVSINEKMKMCVSFLSAWMYYGVMNQNKPNKSFLFTLSFELIFSIQLHFEVQDCFLYLKTN